MTRLTFFRCPSHRGWTLPILTAALLSAACGDVNIQPTAPSSVVPPGGVGVRTLQITGTLTAELGTCFEARVLFDGKELPGSRAACPDASGCTTLELAAVTTSPSGRHTISFQVLRQSADPTDYLADLTVRITREGLSWVLPVRLYPIRATLNAGDSVTFELDLTDWD